jgi:hypothetical protein
LSCEIKEQKKERKAERKTIRRTEREREREDREVLYETESSGGRDHNYFSFR